MATGFIYPAVVLARNPRAFKAGGSPGQLTMPTFQLVLERTSDIYNPRSETRERRYSLFILSLSPWRAVQPVNHGHAASRSKTLAPSSPVSNRNTTNLAYAHARTRSVCQEDHQAIYYMMTHSFRIILPHLSYIFQPSLERRLSRRNGHAVLQQEAHQVSSGSKELMTVG